MEKRDKPNIYIHECFNELDVERRRLLDENSVSPTSKFKDFDCCVLFPFCDACATLFMCKFENGRRKEKFRRYFFRSCVDHRIVTFEMVFFRSLSSSLLFASSSSLSRYICINLEEKF